MPPRAVLNYCPCCGRKNKVEQAAQGICYHCDFTIYEILRGVKLPEGYVIPKKEFEEKIKNARKPA